MPVIRPVPELRNNFVEISDLVHEVDEPVFLTRKGVGDMVVTSIEHFERHMARLELYGKLAEAEAEISAGAAGTDHRVVAERLRKRLRGLAAKG